MADADAALSALTFTPIADAEAQKASPSRNFGTSTDLGADGDPQRISYLRFGVSGINGRVTRAILKCYVTNPSNNGPAVWMTTGDWTESGLTWNNKPAPVTQLANSTKVTSGSWVSFDVTAGVRGNGTYNFVLQADSGDAVICKSREAAADYRPRLSITVGTPYPDAGIPHDAGTPHDGGTVPPNPDGGVVTGSLRLGVYMGSFSSETFRSTFGTYADVETIYYQGDRVTVPNVAEHETQIDNHISPVIDLAFKNGPFTLAQVAAWSPAVQSYFQTFVNGVKTLSDYSASKNNGTRVYFTFEHEAVVKINQRKYTFPAYNGSVPTIQDSAAAWNKVMALVAATCPQAIRLYWYGGSANGEDTYAALLDADLIQMTTFDPYRWSHNQSTDTAASLWGGMVSHLKSQTWMKNANGTLKPWGLTEWGTDATFGDAANAKFVAETIPYLQSQGAVMCNYFDRVDGANDFVFTGGNEPQTLASYTSFLK